jgi:hypothetical protein
MPGFKLPEEVASREHSSFRGIVKSLTDALASVRLCSDIE